MKGLKKLGREDRVLLGSIFTLAWPAMLEQALQTVVQYADSAMVGQLGAQSTAAVPTPRRTQAPTPCSSRPDRKSVV